MNHNHSHSDQDCREMFDKLSAYIDRELDPDAYAAIEKHAADCVKCTICLQTLKRTVELCRKTESRPVPDDFSRHLAFFFSQMVKELSLKP